MNDLLIEQGTETPIDCAQEKTRSHISRILEDEELMGLLRRKPVLGLDFLRAAKQVDEMAGLVKRYHEETTGGFIKFLQFLVLLEVPHDVETGQPLIADGLLAQPLKDSSGKLLLERFFSWQRFHYLWPFVENHVTTSEQLDKDQQGVLLNAISVVRALLGEDQKEPGRVN